MLDWLFISISNNKYYNNLLIQIIFQRVLQKSDQIFVKYDQIQHKTFNNYKKCLLQNFIVIVRHSN